MKKIFALICLMTTLGACAPKVERVGGYSDMRRLTDTEKEFFASVAASIADIEYEPINVSTQVVAGTNYRFLCKARQKGNKKKYYAVIEVHKPLPEQGEPRIVSIERQKR